MYVIPVSVEYFDPRKKITCVSTAPTFPPPPVIPEIMPNDLLSKTKTRISL